MKNVIYGVAIILLGVIVVTTILTITGVMNREIEIEDALQEAVENSVEACTSRHDYSLDNNNQFIADLIVELSNAVENDSDIKIDVMGVDKNKGYLAIRVSEYYTTPIGIHKVAMCETTAFLDKGKNENIIGSAKIIFVDDDGSYLGEQKTEIGKDIKVTITPKRMGKTFNGWLNTVTNEYVGNSLGQASGDVTYKAIYV